MTSILLTSSCTTTVDCYTQAITRLSVAFIATLFHIHISFMIRIPARTSDAVDSIVVDPVRGKVIATFSTGTYEYRNVSRRAILNLILNPNMSLGLWINENVLAKQYNNFKRLCDINKVAFDYA